MRLLHLSDIHFRSPICLTPNLDPDKPFRTRLEQDLAGLCSDGARVDAILMGGDIAYQASPLEYEVAKDWLLQLASMCGCATSGIFTVPGNHDVDWKTCGRVLVSNAQEAIAREIGFHSRDAALLRQLNDAQASKSLFEPLAAYNDFAAQFDCNVFDKRPFWEHTLKLSDEVTLRLHGLTSTFISGSGGRDKGPGQLFLGSSQTVLDPDPDVVTLVLCHHPPSWFSDASQASNIIDARAKLQFFGHEHDQRCMRVQEYIRFLAGAVNPERDAQNWRPGYNLVDLDVVGEGPNRTLEIRAHLRHFQPAPAEFYVPLLASPKESVWRHKIALPARIRPTFVTDLAPTIVVTPLPQPPQPETELATAVHTVIKTAAGLPEPTSQTVQMQEAKVSETSTENLVFRFWQLRANEMRDIALGLGLITEKDLDLLPPQRYFKAMEVAKEQGRVLDLAREIEKHEQSA